MGGNPGKKRGGLKRTSYCILIVDDDPVTKEMIRVALTSPDTHILTTGSCLEAISLFAKNSSDIDIGIFDYILPDGDGLKLLSDIRNMGRCFPVILITAYGTEDVAIRAIRSGGIVDYFKKPLALDQLRARVFEIITGNIPMATEEEAKEVRTDDDFIVDGIIKYAKQNYREERMTFEAAVKVSGMGRFKFCRAFKSRCGMTFTEFLLSVRLANAAETLLNNNLKVSEVAYHVGFNTLPYFNKVFKRKYGISPRQYRFQKRQPLLPLWGKQQANYRVA